jgi:glutamine synthetase
LATAKDQEQAKEYVLRTAREQGVRFVRMWFTDIVGFLKSFSISIEELEGALEEGMGFDGSSIEGFARVDESDMIALPDPSTFQLLPWRPRENAVGRMFCDVRWPGGEPFEGDPRFVLKRNLKRASDLGFTYYVGPELEYFYFKDSDSTVPLDQGGYFDLTPPDVASDLRRDTVLMLEGMGIGVEFSHHEVAVSQHEIDLRYTDALTMADNVMTYRLAVKQVAQQHGVYATFMPKPIFGINGSGMHVHMSIFKGKRNAFFAPKGDYYLSKVARSFVAGLLKHPHIGLHHRRRRQASLASKPSNKGAVTITLRLKARAAANWP